MHRPNRRQTGELDQPVQGVCDYAQVAKDKQQRFIDEYLQCWNASEAARRAGYSAKTAAQIGYENLRKPEIQSEIKRRLESEAMSSFEVLHRLAAIARSDASAYIVIDKEGQPYFDFAAAKAAGVLHLIKKINYDKDGSIRSVEFHDAQGALVDLGRHHKLFTDKVEHEGNVVPIAIIKMDMDEL